MSCLTLNITFVGDRAIKIPVPFETGVMVHGMTQRMFNYFMKKDPAAFEEFMGSVASAMLPNFIPTIGNPFIETWANKNFFTGARIVPMGKEDLISKYQYKTGTSSTARVIGRAMTYMLGQETRSKAASPAVIDHFITSWGEDSAGSLLVSAMLLLKAQDSTIRSQAHSKRSLIASDSMPLLQDTQGPTHAALKSFTITMPMRPLSGSPSSMPKRWAWRLKKSWGLPANGSKRFTIIRLCKMRTVPFRTAKERSITYGTILPLNLISKSK